MVCIFPRNGFNQLNGESSTLHSDPSFFNNLSLIKQSIVQVVGYLHKFNATERGGDFVSYRHYSKFTHVEGSDLNLVHAHSYAASAVDGSKSVHAATMYKERTALPFLNKDKVNKLIYNEDESWNLESNGEFIKKYRTDDIRMTIVYRARCFVSEEERMKFKEEQTAAKKLENYADALSLDTVLTTFATDLLKLGKVSSVKSALEMKRLDFASLILDTYVQYPTNTERIFPLNYCIFDRQFKFLTPLLKAMGC